LIWDCLRFQNTGETTKKIEWKRLQTWLQAKFKNSEILTRFEA
jgi:hypothetical protein